MSHVLLAAAAAAAAAGAADLRDPLPKDHCSPRSTMLKTIEAVLESDGNVRLLEAIDIPGPKRALVTLLDDPCGNQIHETALLSEPALAEDWNREEEYEAWKHLQRVP